jgi:hypothetical protein
LKENQRNNPFVKFFENERKPKKGRGHRGHFEVTEANGERNVKMSIEAVLPLPWNRRFPIP